MKNTIMNLCLTELCKYIIIIIYAWGKNNTGQVTCNYVLTNYTITKSTYEIAKFQHSLSIEEGTINEE